ncbi:leucine-rich PPR motif-containing protein, mitochondrial [Anabrus simplex]|uniref:leucine-rich PPR motif-containing protein, mitochondrial n=1 Tax=Anabrus simplex TaxID=316456 RepID=UPI0035A279CF
MHSVCLWTSLFKTFRRIHLSRCLTASLADQSKQIARREVECCRVNFLSPTFGKKSRVMLINTTRDTANYITSLEGTSQNNGSRVDRLVLRLNSDINNLRRVYRSDVEHLLYNLEAEDVQQDNQEVEILLLQCCGNLLPDEHPTNRVNLVHEVWKILEGLGASFSVQHYNMLLRSYVENGHKISVAEFLTKMRNVKPNDDTYQLLLAAVCGAGDIAQAINVISRMKSEGFPASEAVFNSLVLGHARAGDLASATAVLDTMRTAQVLPTIDTYATLMKAYIEAGDMNKVLKVYQEAEAANMSLTEPQLMDIVISAAVSGNQLLIPEVLKLIPEGSIDLTPTIINTVVHLVYLGCEKGAYFILRAVPLDSDFIPKDDLSTFGAFFIREMVKARRPAESIIEICDLLAADGRNSRALHKATEAALSLACTELALILLKALKKQGAPLRPHYFWPIFLSLGKQDGEKGVLFVLNHMIELGVNVDLDTLVDYILPHTASGDPESLVRKLQAHGLHLRELLTSVVLVLLRSNQIKNGLQLCRRFESPVDTERLLRPLVDAYISTKDITSAVGLLKIMILSSSKEGNDWAGHFILEVLTSTKNGSKNIDNILKAYQQQEIPISSFVGDIISNYTVQNGFSEEETKNVQVVVDSLVHSGLTMSSPDILGQHIPHPRDMSVEELECHLVELKSKNLNTRGVLRRLLQLYCRQGNLEKAIEIKKEFEAANYEFSAGMQASLFDLHVKLGQVDDAELTLMELLKTAPGFSLDDFKILDFATLLVANNKYRGAIAILEKQAGFKGVKGGPTVVRNCWRLLQAVAEKGEPQKVKHMLGLLVTLGYCSISNILLGPVVRAHLIQGSLVGAVKEYKQCASEYRKTPLQHELLCQLVSVADKADSDGARLLKEVLAATKSVHGAASTNVAFAVALAETGKTKQLQKMIMDSSVNLKPSILMTRCKRLADEGKISTLENLADVSKGIQNFDSSALYNLMMKVYNQRGDCDGALSLWTTLQEQDIHPSETFLSTLASLLRSNKRDVPFIVPSGVNRK